PEVVWRTLTTGALMARWLMKPEGFEAVVGNRFTYRTRPAGAWDGTIRCEVLEVVPNQRFAYAWWGGDDGIVGYGSRLDTVVTFTVSPVDGGTRLTLVHSGFEVPRNQSALQTMGDGWKKVVPGLAGLMDEA
ncbi:MAG: SRPBCC family protein, partial [Ferrovibrionaceae bacterium]